MPQRSALLWMSLFTSRVYLIQRHFPTPNSLKSNPMCVAIVLCPSACALGKIKGQETWSQTHRKFSLLVEHDIKENRQSLRLLRKPKEVMEGLLLWSNCVLIAHESLNARQLKGVPKLEFLALETPYGPQHAWNSVGHWKGPREVLSNVPLLTNWGSAKGLTNDERARQTGGSEGTPSSSPAHVRMAIDAPKEGGFGSQWPGNNSSWPSASFPVE